MVDRAPGLRVGLPVTRGDRASAAPEAAVAAAATGSHLAEGLDGGGPVTGARGLFQLAGRGVQLAEFYRSHMFCGYCGHTMHPSKTEWAMLCGGCRERYYPQIAPCIIVAIRRDDHILLAQHTRHRNGIYTVLAGFVEVGETLEQTVAREVMEESGIRVKNLRYVTSQPWPFPQSLMTAFMAEYESGDITIDPNELLDAGWYRYDQLPLLPPPGTVARRLIEDTVALCRGEYEGRAEYE